MTKRKIAVLCTGLAHNTILSILEGMKEASFELGVDLYIFNCYTYTEFSGYPNNTGFSIYRLINYQDFDGVIILADLINNLRVLEKERQRILAAKIPAVSINYKLEGIRFLRVDTYSAFYEIVNHLIKEHGVKDLVFYSGRENSFENTERYKAFRQALKDNQIELTQDKIWSIKNGRYNNAYEFALEKFSTIERMPGAIVCANDFIALGTLKAAEEKKIQVPQTLKITGCDDIHYSRSVIPSLTTVDGSLNKLGFKSVMSVINGADDDVVQIQGEAIFRESCGCETEINLNQKLSDLNELDRQSQSEEFTSQVDHLEDIFTEATDVFTLLTSLENFLKMSHKYEGSDFCIFLKSDWTSVFVNSEENLPQNLEYGSQVQSVISIMNNEKYLREMINTRDLIPSKMKSERPSTYLFMPIYNHSYVHGYFVAKNSFTLIKDRFGYTWTRKFGSSIELFRKRNMYKQMSQQFLRLSTNDALSGLLNRIGLDKLAKPFYEKNKKNGLTSILYFVDINSMKTINDKFGHLHGDLAVKTIASVISSVIPKNWLAIRYGGDEFLILGNNQNYKGEKYEEIISMTIKKKTSIMQLPYNLSASVGSYVVPPSSMMSLEEAIKQVDQIMYAKKQAFHNSEKK